ncbi:glycosyltransferase [Halosquirtibacter xylanolyticus]|uniref:glycosyltransferase n=1 Tax=Halosquirtibacter xylanolyticus TaxID=3374599 RepID=UPI00374A5B7E|nr:glycosyltransferase [Prolixibacteraceae bacterium]
MCNSILSIIIPIYNVEDFIDKCVRSVVSSSSNKYEVILVNDGSPDNSAIIAKKYAEKYDFVKFVNKKNGGLSSARNEGLKFVTGKYIWFVDSDDWIEDGAIDKLIELIEKNNSIDMFHFSAVSYFNENHIEFLRRSPLKREQIKAANFYNKEIYQPNVWLNLYRTELLKEHGLIFNEELSNHEDDYFMQDFIQCANNVMLLPESLYYYRQDSRSLSTVNTWSRAESLYLLLDKTHITARLNQDEKFFLWYTYFITKEFYKCVKGIDDINSHKIDFMKSHKIPYLKNPITKWKLKKFIINHVPLIYYKFVL